MNKKKLFTLLLLLAGLGSTAMADNVITTNEVVIRPGGTTELIVNLENDADFKVYAYDFRLYLPDGIEVAKKDNGKYIYELAARNADHSSDVQMTTDGAVQFGVNSSSLYLTGSEGPVLSITLKADATLAEGTYQASITKITYANKEAQTVHPTDVTFSIEVNNQVVLDEESTTVPVAESGANVLVKRTINADEWSTICLPFAMSSEQVKAAFGDDVKLADFDGVETTFDDADNVVNIKAKFHDVTAIEANHPYIIMVSKKIEKFTVDNVDIIPEEDEAYIEFDNGKTGSRRVLFSGFYGTYHAETTLDEFMLFLSENKFWYSKGKTKMKAFRAYFDFVDVLTEVENAGARISMTFGDETTGIGMNGDVDAPTAIYDMLGRKVEKPSRKGLYIKNGEKVVIK